MDKKHKFERWIITQFGEHIKRKLADFDIEDGYHDETINAMWIGFCAGMMVG
ncbi:hypothetical protein [Pseudoalteromonas sp. BDTF-M6]|uniref:hypothetical protein n=1 Tax=Pseudoalteromonas sp. BDTF-M6 TaxID=2796132 RepID=UPI001BAEBDEF|nr:hypothetical protein [Pseudoalteromonas sp. BDTF-M6]MBS3796699.1 hypothetical protein [Pseudoalteromonas sp. BDTF-M6]